MIESMRPCTPVLVRSNAQHTPAMLAVPSHESSARKRSAAPQPYPQPRLPDPGPAPAAALRSSSRSRTGTGPCRRRHCPAAAPPQCTRSSPPLSWRAPSPPPRTGRPCSLWAAPAHSRRRGGEPITAAEPLLRQAQGGRQLAAGAEETAQGPAEEPAERQGEALPSIAQRTVPDSGPAAPRPRTPFQRGSTWQREAPGERWQCTGVALCGGLWTIGPALRARAQTFSDIPWLLPWMLLRL